MSEREEGPEDEKVYRVSAMNSSTVRPEARISNGNFDLPRLDRQRHSALGTDLETKGDCFADIAQSLLTASALANATGDGGAFGHPYSIFIAVQCHRKPHPGKHRSISIFLSSFI
jgi:hypothetical protein